MQVGNLYTLRVPRRTKIEGKTNWGIGWDGVEKRSGKRGKEGGQLCAAIRPGLFDLCFYTLK